MKLHDSVAFVAAPYGFGPTSKAIALSSHLPRNIGRVFFGHGPPLTMALESKEFSSCVTLDFKINSNIAAFEFSKYRVVIFVNTTRFLAAAVRNCERVVFVDTLAWLREDFPVWMGSVSAYFAQKFFDVGIPFEIESLSNFRLTGAIVPKAFMSTTRRGAQITKSPVVHCGGLFSPTMQNGADVVFVTSLFTMLKSTGSPVRVILPPHLHARLKIQHPAHISLIASSPSSIGDHICGSSFALTTSGIEFTYESILSGIPTFFLPAFNATQLFQLQYHRENFADSVPFDLVKHRVPLRSMPLDDATVALQKEGMLGRWNAQFTRIGEALNGLLSDDNLLSSLRKSQTNAIHRVGTDGGETVASYILRSFGEPSPNGSAKIH